MKNKTKALYIHVPFCLQKCLYCDFCSFPHASQDTMRTYTQALLAEMQARKDMVAGAYFDTVFFGGGTPTLLPLDCYEALFDGMHRFYRIDPDAEITAEANPASADIAYLTALRQMGVNRLSMGMQSAHEKELKMLGRVHSAADADAFFADARNAGFSNINIDLMYAIPGQTLVSFAQTVEHVLTLEPEHISAYGLIIEEGTPFAAKNDLALPGEDAEVEMYRLLQQKLPFAGYTHYEISNYAKAGYSCRHNLHYWQADEYLGLGVAAYSYLNGERFGNGRDLANYVASPHNAISEREVLQKQELAYEYIMLSFRLAQGVNTHVYQHRFGEDFTVRYQNEIQKFSNLGLLKQEEDRVFLTDEGMEVSNAILVEFMDA